MRGSLRHGAGYRERVAEHALVVAMIETAEGLDAVEAIAAVPGLGGLFVGPADLGLALGVGPQTDGDAPAAQRAALADGVDWVVVANELKLIADGTAAKLAAMRAP